MLVSMTVRNIALIEQLQIEFQKGMQVLSGETGAGKSIIVDSINLVLGERADRGLIRSGWIFPTAHRLRRCWRSSSLRPKAG